MASRLDRLLSLVEKGTTPQVRNAAAQQLGEIQRQQGCDLQYLLTALYGFLGKDSWETRVAAAHALEEVVQHVPVWNPKGEQDTDADVPVGLQFSDFDISVVLANAAPLLASGGEELDYQPIGDERARMIRELELLRRRLGLVQADMDIVTESDLLAAQPAPDPADEVMEGAGGAELSVRQRYAMKRKAKQTAREEKSAKTLKIVSNADLHILSAATATTWPLQPIVDALVQKLFDRVWEDRHGACVGLRAVLKKHASGAARRVGSQQMNDRRNAVWLEDVSLRLLSVLALDRFGDFVADSVTAPVRESAAQALAVLLTHLPTDAVVKVAHSLFALCKQQDWNVRHGGMLGLKYLIAVREDCAEAMLDELLPLLHAGIGDSDDDVVAVAAEAMLPLAVYVMKRYHEQAVQLVTSLWSCLERLTDLSAATAHIMQLLAKFYSFTSFTATGTGEDLGALVPRLWRFFRHNVTSVRKAVLSTLERLLQTHQNDWVRGVASDALLHLFKNMLVEEHHHIVEDSQRCWGQVILVCGTNAISSSVAPHLQQWLSMVTVLPSHPSCPPPFQRYAAIAALARLFSACSPADAATIERMVVEYLASSSATHRTVACALLADTCNNARILWSAGVQQKLLDLAEATPIDYAEMSTALERLDVEAKSLAAKQRQCGTAVPAAPATGVYTLADALALARVNPPKQAEVEEAHNRLLATIGYLQTHIEVLHNNICTTAAQAMVAMAFVPPRLNPVIRPLMTAVKSEEVALLQERSARALAQLVYLLKSRVPSPSDRMIFNVCELLPSGYMEPPNPQDEVVPGAVVRRGASMTISAVAATFGADLFTAMPRILSCMTDNLATPDLKQIGSLATIESVVRCVHEKLHGVVLELLPRIFACVQSDLELVRAAAARTVSAYCEVLTVPSMALLLQHLIPMMGDTTRVASRLGAVMALDLVVEKLDIKLLSYLSFFVVPIMARMSDNDDAVRRLATHIFATLVRLMPLEEGAAAPEGLPPALMQQRATNRVFVQQLVGGGKVEKYELPMKVNVTLRSYQQEGVNWLAFLNKYNLHGILADDMGLGKTLQTICVVVGDHVNRKAAWAQTQSVDSRPLPSLIVCPSTIVAHWYFEVVRFTELEALQYVGPKQSRAALQKQFANKELVITSYEVLRNDVDVLSEIFWNYCVLDEGHIIRNGTSAITKACKRVKANHRLLLTGTPIQNNVLELWSLFDFLMPGFLGTERQFNTNYSKPLKASRDPKCSEKDAEAGVLALERLHRQVLPFILRRMKSEVADLPPKIIQDLYCELSPVQARLYEDFSRRHMSGELSELESGGASKPKQQHIFQALQYLRKLCSHPALVLTAEHPEYAQINKELTSPITSLEHAPKLTALRDLLVDCGIGTVDMAGTKSNAAAAAAASAGGVEDETSAVVGQHRVLVFCQQRSMLDIIERDLFKPLMPSVTYMRLDGNIEARKRMEIVMRFNADPTIDVLLLTTHVGGLGLNLTGADTVVFMEHDWNPQKDLQAMDRAHRLGQVKTVNVYRFITRGTLEEKIMGLQRFKLNIANMVVNAENASLRTMDTHQVVDLFKVSDAEPGKAPSQAGAAEAMDVDDGKSGVKAALAGLEELWDESQYDEEYNMEGFLRSLK